MNCVVPWPRDSWPLGHGTAQVGKPNCAGPYQACPGDGFFYIGLLHNTEGGQLCDHYPRCIGSLGAWSFQKLRGDVCFQEKHSYQMVSIIFLKINDLYYSKLIQSFSRKAFLSWSLYCSKLILKKSANQEQLGCHQIKSLFLQKMSINTSEVSP